MDVTPVPLEEDGGGIVAVEADVDSRVPKARLRPSEMIQAGAGMDHVEITGDGEVRRISQDPDEPPGEALLEPRQAPAPRKVRQSSRPLESARKATRKTTRKASRKATRKAAPAPEEPVLVDPESVAARPATPPPSPAPQVPTSRKIYQVVPEASRAVLDVGGVPVPGSRWAIGMAGEAEVMYVQVGRPPVLRTPQQTFLVVHRWGSDGYLQAPALLGMGQIQVMVPWDREGRGELR